MDSDILRKISGTRDSNFNDIENPLGFGSDDVKESYLKQAEAYNSQKGKGDCFACKGRGLHAFVDQYYGIWRVSFEPCRNCSGKGTLTGGPTMEGYAATESWQKEVKTKAEAYVNEMNPDTWFFIGGPVGSGKSHICKSILDKLSGERPVLFFWNTDRQSLVGIDADTERIRELQRAQCLYIDDFFCGNPTDGDINLARRILDYRYEHRLRTIISSEKSYVGIRKVSEGTASRISEMTVNEIFCISIRGGNADERMQKDYRR